MNTTVGENINTAYLPSSFVNENGGLAVSEEQALEVSKGIGNIVSQMPAAERNAFLSMIKNPSFAPNATVEEALNPATLQTFEDIAEILSQPITSNAARLLGRLMIELGAQQRQDALESRLLARSVAQTELEAGADQLREAAQSTKDGAKAALITSSVMSSVAIGVSAGAGAASVSGAKTAHGYQGNKAEFQFSDAGLASAKMGAYGQGGNGGAQGLNGLGNAGSGFASAGGQAGSQEAQARQSELQASAEVTKGEKDLEANEQQALQEFVSQIIQFIKELRDAEVEQLAVVTRG